MGEIFPNISKWAIFPNIKADPNFDNRLLQQLQAENEFSECSKGFKANLKDTIFVFEFSF